MGMLRRIGLLIAFAGAMALGLTGATSASAAEQLVGSCDVARDGTTSGFTMIGETFTSQLTGSLTRAEVDVHEDVGSTDDYVVSVRAVDGVGAPTATVLASTTIPDASVPVGDSFLNAVFPNPAPVSAGQNYALLLERPVGLKVGGRADSCPNSGIWFGTQIDTLSLDTFRDIIFRVFGTPPSPPSTTTGQRAAALKNCKKKKSKKARKKCKKKANLLPV